MLMKKLVNLLIAKSILETILVSALAVAVWANAFPPTFHGLGEPVADRKNIVGWAVNDADPWERVQVQLFIDGKFVATQVAQQWRPDVLAAGWSKDEWVGYNFAVGQLSPGAHEARVYALHPSRNGGRYTLQLLGDPIRFQVNVDGSWK